MDELINIEEELMEVEVARMVIPRNPKIYFDRQDPLEIYDDDAFRRRYRMSKPTAEFLINLIRDQIENFYSNRGMPVSATVQVLCAIRYLAKGAYGVDMADHHGISQPSLSLIVKKVAVAIARHRNRFIKFPRGEDLHQVKADFYRIAHCPSIVGAIDGTQIKIKNPGGENPLLFMNRKGFYSLNVQAVCDAKCKFLDIVARWRGSTHDARIWNESQLKRKFLANEIDGILLGDNGYPCSKYLITPLLNPVTNSEERYNVAHRSTRNVIERTFGIWKNRFRSFFNGLNLKLQTTKAVIVATAIIHNIILEDRLANNDSDDDEDAYEGIEIFLENREDNIQGNAFRARYIENYFN